MGLDSVFFLVFNGLLIGTIVGYLFHIGYHLPFCGFVIGHSAMELNAIVLSGAAGLRLGAALIRLGRLSRVRALREQGRVAVQLLYGAALMFLSAAFIEVYWSSIDGLPLALKFSVGGCCGCWLSAISVGWVVVMELDKATVVIRPRNAWEAMDLGFKLIRHQCAPVYAAWFATVFPFFGCSQYCIS